MCLQPSRHLDGQSLMKNEHLVPFSVGKRACLGESLAKMELFIIYANLFKSFNIRKVANVDYSTKPVFAFTASAQHYNVDLSKR
jgi:cytochrome P450